MKKIFTLLVVLASALSVFAQGSKAGGLLGRTTSATEPNLVEVVAAGDQASVFTSSPVCYIPCGTLEKYEASAWVSQVSKFVEECDDAGAGGKKSIITYTSTDGNTLTPKAGAFGGANIVSNTYAGGVGTITFDAVVTEIGDDAFAECHTLATVVLPEGVTELGGNAFEACENLVSVSLPEGLQTIGMNAFLSCDHLVSVVIPNSVTSVGINAFNGCSSLKSVGLSENLQEIESGLFNACESLDYIVIPSSVTSIAKNAFYGCVGLDSIRCMSIKPAELANKRNVFYGMEKNIPVYVPCIAGGVSSVEAYQAAWGNYFNNFKEPRPRYSVALSVNNDVMGTAKIGERNTECGVEIVAVPNTGYEFVEWADGNKLSTRTLVLESDSAMQAIFKPIRYTITAVAGDEKHGAASDTVGDYNTEVKISATPKFGYRFNYWNDGNQDNPRQVLVLGEATYIAYFKEALVKDTIEVSVCDNTTYVDPIKGGVHEIESDTPASLTWNDSVWGSLDQKDTLYTFVVTPLVAPKSLTQADLEEGLAVAVPVLVPGYEPDTTASVAAIWNYYKANDDEKTADVVSVKWNYSGKVKCDDTSFAMALIVKDTCGNELKTACDFVVKPNIVRDTLVAETCESYKWAQNDSVYTKSGKYVHVDTTAAGCDSVYHVLDLTVWGNDTIHLYDTVCPGTVALNGELLYKDTALTTIGTNNHGCPEVTIMHWHVHNVLPVTVVNKQICAGDTLTWLGEKYSTPVVVTDTLPSQLGCDSVVTLILQVWEAVQETVIVDTICEGETYVWSDNLGTPYTTTQRDTVILSTENGCDSVRILDLTVLPKIPVTTIYDTICNGLSYEWVTDTVMKFDGKLFEGTTEASRTLYTENGCDSVVKLYLTELPAIPVTEIDTTIIFGKAYYSQADKKAYTSSVDTTFVLKTVKHGCDSLVHLNLTVLPAIPPTVIDTTICAGESYYWTAGDTTFTTSAKNKRKHLTDAHGCDSLVILNLTVLNPIPVTVIDTVTCHGVPFFWSLTGKYYSHSQVVDTILTSVHGCDSVVSLHLTELPKMDTTMIHATVCHGEPYVWDLDGEKYFGTQTIDTILPSVHGCDSVVILSLVELPAVAVTEIDTTICFGEAYYFEANEKVYTESKDTIVTLKDVNGCDSLVRLSLIVLAPIPATVVDTTICHGETYYWAAGDTIFTTPVYGRQVTVSSAHGCDSLVVLNLTILPEVKATVTDTVTCHGESFFWAVTGQYYSGTQVVDTVMQDIHGCDSVVRLNLVELPKMDTTFINDTTCFGVPYKWDVTGKQYTGSCTVDTILSSIYGCDSVVRLNLVEMPEILPVVTKDTICAGEPFSWRGTLYNTTGTYNDTVVTAEGCDSIYTLMLHVWPAVAPTEVYDTICHGETYKFNDTIYTESITTTATLKNVNGCDSVVTLMLYVWPENKDSITVTEYLCHGVGSFLWEVNNVVYTKDTLAKAVLQDVHGCDSVVFLNLVSLPLITDTVVETICYGDSAEWFGKKYNTTGIYDHKLTSVLTGCDSIVVLNLTVLPEILPEVTNGTTCAGVAYEWRGKAYKAAGTYTESVKTANGCDSVYVLNLQVWPAVAPTEVYDTICAGETYTYNNKTYTSSIVTDVTLTSINGCDSLVHLNLHFLPENKDSITVTEYLCYGTPNYVWSVTGEAYSTDTLVRGVLPDVHGCDSVVFLNLVSLPLITDTVVETICYGDSAEWFGKKYNTTGIYDHKLTSVLTGCDSVKVLNLTVLPEILETVIHDTIYQGDIYNWGGVEYTATGDYTRTLSTDHGCDSVVTLKLYVRPLIELVTTDTICAGDSYTWNEFVYTSTTDTIIQIARDTTLHLNLTVLSPIPDTVYNVSICEGEEYTWFGVKYTTTTYRRDTLPSVHGCDSVSVLNLTVWPKQTPITFVDTICHGETYEWEGDVYNDSVMVTKTLTDIHGCDSIVTLKLAVLPPVPSTEETVVACDTYTWHEKEYTMTGDYVDTIPSATGCDSIVTLHLTINYSAIKHLYDTVCDTYTWYTGDVFTKTGIYYDTLATEQGCDSVVALHLTVNHRIETEETIAICYGESLTWNGVVYSATGDYQFDTLTVHGCDSIVHLHLTVLPEMRVDSDTLAVCPSQLPYEWHGQLLEKTGVYEAYEQFAANNNCNSVLHVLNFEVLPETSSDTIVVACDSYTWNGMTYDQSGDYSFITTGANGCDSVAHLHLTVNYSTETHDYQTICYGQTYNWNHTIYDATGNYIDTLTSVLTGCDSIVTLHLTILPEVVNVAEEQVICPSELPYNFWRGYSLTESGLYYDTVANSLGCDSIIYALKLKVLPIDTTRSVIAACDSFTWDVTGQTYDRSGQWVYQVHGSDGCDSVIILDLTITNTIYKDTSVTECVSYEWDGHLYTESGDYTKTYSAVNHCDSIVTLHLTILKPSTGSEDVYICHGETYTWEGDVYDTSGEYVKTLTNAAGCDSTAHLYLTVLPEMTYKYDTIFACAGLPYEWKNLSLTESGEYTYREQFAANASCDSIEHVLTFIVYDMSLPDTISQPIAICGKPIDLMKATDQIESYIASISHYAPNATVVWQEWIDGVWVDYDYETLKGSQSEIIIRYAIITDCGVIYSDEMVLVVEQATVESKYGNRIFLFDLNAFSSTFDWTPTPEQVSWYKVVGEVDVYGEMGDDELVGVGHSYNLPEGEVMVGGYYAIVEQHAVSVDDCETIYRSTVIYATASGIAPKLVPNVVYPDEVLTIKNLDESQIHQILVYGASGELIATYKADKVGEFMFNAANATGYYLVDIINTNGSTTLRYVVK